MSMIERGQVRRKTPPYTFPDQYVEDGRVLWVYVGDASAKTWWRNLTGGAEVELLLRRRARAGAAVALLHAERPAHVEEGLAATSTASRAPPSA